MLPTQIRRQICCSLWFCYILACPAAAWSQAPPSPTAPKNGDVPPSQPTAKNSKTSNTTQDKTPGTSPNSPPQQEEAQKKLADKAREQRRKLRELRKQEQERQQKLLEARLNDPLVKGGIYDRPYLYRQGQMIAIGGYVEMLGQYLVEDGVSKGFSFEARRFNLFIFSSISRLIRLTAEIEYEHGSEEIAVETALLDVRFHPMINLRGGILLVPLGKFNVSHDAPIYDVIDRPLVSTQIIPATYSDIGFGLFGAFYPALNHKLTYEIYAVNGLTSGIIANAAEGTRIAKGKSKELFGEDQNGLPAFAVRLAYESSIGLDFGVSLYAGVYNQFQREGETIADMKWLTIFAANAEFSYGPLSLRAEFAWAHIQLPENLPEIFASDQWGIYIDAMVRVWQGKMLFLPRAALYIVGRFDYIDLNMGKRQGTQESFGDETIRITAGISFRPTPQTSIRIVYQHNWLTDFLNNPSRSAGVQFGMASYF